MTAAAEKTPAVIAEQIALDRAQRREERQSMVAIASADLAAVPSRTSFLPGNMGEAMQLASLMADSNFVPLKLRDRAGDCLAIVMQASRWGMDPFAVANKAYFVKDGSPPAWEAQLVNAVVNTSGALMGRLDIEYTGDGAALRCTVTGYLKADPGRPKVKTQSIARVKTQNSPLWKDDPEQQLGYYTTRAWARLHCPEVLLGVYTPDEDPDYEPDKMREPVAMPRRGDVPALSARAERSFDMQSGAVVDSQTGEILEDQGKPAAKAKAERQSARAAPVGQAVNVSTNPDLDAEFADAFEAKVAAATTILAVSELEMSLPADLPVDQDLYLIGVCGKRKDELRNAATKAPRQ